MVPVAVMLDGAAFQHEVECADRRAGESRDVVADRGVAGQIELAAPAIGPESERDRAVLGAGEDRAGVAQPDIAVAGRNDLGHAAELGAGRRLGFRARHQHAHTVGWAKRADQPRHVAARACQVAVPFVRIGRPGGPDRLLRRPFRRDGHGLCGHGNSHEIFPKLSPGGRAWPKSSRCDPLSRV